MDDKSTHFIRDVSSDSERNDKDDMFKKLNDPCFDFSSKGELVDEDADSDFRG